MGGQKEKWRLKKAARPIRKAETEKEWEAKMVWEVSKKSRGQEEGKSLRGIKRRGRQKRLGGPNKPVS